MAEFADLVKDDFDLVLFDSPPIISLSDSLVLASYMEAVILVVKCGRFPHELIRQAKAQLEGVKATFLGVLLNSVDLKNNGYYYGYYSDYYDSYGSQSGEK